MRRAPPLSLALVALALFGLVASACTADAPPGAIHVLEANGNVNGVFERYLERGIEQAERAGAVAVIIEIDTPGGEIGAMRRAVSHIETAAIPVITYVSPAGAQAASAGTFIVMAGHVAAMAPSTTIGAASPVTGTGEDIEGTLGEKVENDTAAFARGIAELRERNADWAEQAVREAVSASPAQAVELDVVDLEASSVAGLIEAIEGREVTLLAGAETTLALQGAPVFENPQNLYERVLALVSDPVVVSLLLLFGLAGIGIELFAPGVFLPGTLGALALVAALLGLGTLLPGEAAAVFIALALILFVLEAFVPSGGVLGAVGALALLAGAAAWLGQASTELDFARILTVIGLTLGAIILVITLWVLFLAKRYLAGREPPGAARL